jgi:hypothetical protein
MPNQHRGRQRLQLLARNLLLCEPAAVCCARRLVRRWTLKSRNATAVRCNGKFAGYSAN